MERVLFSRIQNLHISQTNGISTKTVISLVEFKIYISLKPGVTTHQGILSLVEFKIYISLKHE